MTKDIFGNPTVGGFGNSCTKEVFEATANTAASICNSGTTLYSICFGAANEEVKNPNTGAYISLFEYLNTYIALNKTYSANDFSGLKDAFDAISSSITSGLSSGTVHDSLPDGVTCISGDFEGNRNLTGATGEPGEGGVTTYTYTKTYTVKIDPTAVDAERYDGYYPLNGPTTLTVKGSNDEDVTIDFPIPAGKVTLQKYDLTINYKYADGTEAKPTHTESLTYGSSYSVASPLITGYTADKLTVSGSMPDSDVTVDVTFTAKDYTVTYEPNGGSTVPSQTVKYNETANKPADPTKSGYTFAGWYTEEKLTNKYDFATPVTGNITLYAKWTRNYTAYRQAEALGMRAERDIYGNVTVPELKQLDAEYAAALKNSGVTAAGDMRKDYDWQALTPEQKKRWQKRARMAWKISEEEKELDAVIVYNERYAERMRQLMAEKREYVVDVENNQ